eukprot:1748225-Prymnesium_polylepis.1
MDVLQDGETRYDTRRLLWAWLLSAPSAFVLRTLWHGALFGIDAQMWDPAVLGRFGTQSGARARPHAHLRLPGGLAPR